MLAGDGLSTVRSRAANRRSADWLCGSVILVALVLDSLKPRRSVEHFLLGCFLWTARLAVLVSFAVGASLWEFTFATSLLAA